MRMHSSKTPEKKTTEKEVVVCQTRVQDTAGGGTRSIAVLLATPLSSIVWQSSKQTTIGCIRQQAETISQLPA